MSDLRQSRKGMEPVPPDFLTVEEAGDVLRLGRTAAYQLAREFLAAGGAVGISVVRYGRQLRVPRCRLEDVLGGPLTWPPHAAASAAALPADPSSKVVASRHRDVRPRAGAADPAARLFSL